MTPEDIEERVREEHPEFTVSEGGEVITITPESDPERYEEMISERVQWRIAQQERDTVEHEEYLRAEQMKARYHALRDGTATARQVQEVTAYLLRKQHQDLAP